MREWVSSLRGLAAFDATARTLSFTHAAAELNVLQPAISRQISRLESELGTALFERTRPRLTLTADGERLRSAVGHGFSHIARTLEQIKTRHSRGVIVDVSIGFATCWLLARLAAFRRDHPEIEVQIRTRDANLAYDREHSDVVVIFGEGGDSGFTTIPIFRECLFPVASPDYLPSGKDLRAAELTDHRLLFLRDALHGGDWAILLGSIDLVPPAPPTDSEFNSYIVYLQAILNGEGIGLGWGHLVDDLLSSGQLRRVSDIEVTTNRGYHCAIPRDHPHNEHVATFVAWLTSHAGLS